MKLYLIAKGTPLLEKGYKGVFESLSEEKQSELIRQKVNFANMVRPSLGYVTLSGWHLS